MDNGNNLQFKSHAIFIYGQKVCSSGRCAYKWKYTTVTVISYSYIIEGVEYLRFWGEAGGQVSITRYFTPAVI